MTHFVDDLLLNPLSDWKHIAKPLSNAPHVRLNLGAVNRGMERVPADPAIYFIMMKGTPKVIADGKTRVLINGVAWLKSAFGLAGAYVDSRYFKSEGGKRKTFKSEGAKKRWVNNPDELFKALKLGGYQSSKEAVQKIIQAALAKHPTNLIKIGQAKSLSGRISGYTNPKYPMTKSLLGPGLMDHVEMVAFLGVNLSLEPAMIAEYTRRFGAPPIWEQK